MEGLRKSRDDSDAIWFMLGVGAIVFILNLLEKEYDARNREAWARERALEKEREKERKASFLSPPPRFNYECYAEKNGQETLLCELDAKDWGEAEQKAVERKQMMLRSGKPKYDDIDWSTFTVRAKS